MQDGGKHWAVEVGSETNYIPGSDADTAREAERVWRETRRLYFMTVMVRRTTPEEDQRLDN